jgi:glycosyltransferase involved in cell wall biosynthesis
MALEQISKDIPDVQLLVVGGKNTYAEKMIGIAKKSGIAERIVFTGWLTGRDLHLAYHAASIAVTPSLCFDSFIMVNLEAMACRKPAITTCFGGAREVVIDGVTGYVINPYDVKMMSARITELLKDDEKRRHFGQVGYERAVKEFSLEQCARTYVGLFQKPS